MPGPSSSSSNIDAIISGVSGNTRADFSGLAEIPEAYRKGKDFAYQQGLRNVFKDDNGNFRQDLLDDRGNPDSGKMYERLMQVGGAPAIESASKLAEMGLLQDRYRNAPTVDAVLRGEMPLQPTSNIPPSASRSAPTVVAAPSGSGRGGTEGQSPTGYSAATTGPDGSWRGGNHPNSLISFLSNNGVPETDQGSAANILGGQLAQVTGRRVDPNAPLDLNNPQVRQVLGDFVRTNRGAGSQTSTAVEQPVSSDPTLGGLVPAGYEPGAYVRRLEAVAGSGRVLPDQLKILQGRIEAIHKALELTPDMKNARAAGMSVRNFLDRSDANMAERDIITKSILPKLDKSQEAATAARDEIQAINQAREQLDMPGGIFSGSAADVRLRMAKIAEFIGVPNSDKIANTEAFGSAIGKRVLSIVKGLGAGAGISNADREFAAAMGGGNIKLDERSIRRILDIGERAARARIDQHNKLSDRTVKATEALRGFADVYRVQQPDQYQRSSAAPPPKVGDIIDGHRFLGGNPNDQKSWGAL